MASLLWQIVTCASVFYCGYRPCWRWAVCTIARSSTTPHFTDFCRYDPERTQLRGASHTRNCLGDVTHHVEMKDRSVRSLVRTHSVFVIVSPGVRAGSERYGHSSAAALRSTSVAPSDCRGTSLSIFEPWRCLRSASCQATRNMSKRMRREAQEESAQPSQCQDPSLTSQFDPRDRMNTPCALRREHAFYGSRST